MKDELILDLYWKRDETAIQKTQEKYGVYLNKVAYDILADIALPGMLSLAYYLRAWNKLRSWSPGNKHTLIEDRILM